MITKVDLFLLRHEKLLIEGKLNQIIGRRIKKEMESIPRVEDPDIAQVASLIQPLC